MHIQRMCEIVIFKFHIDQDNANIAVGGTITLTGGRPKKPPSWNGQHVAV